MFRKILVGMVVGLVSLVGVCSNSYAEIYSSISGRVVDADTGEGIEGATVVVRSKFGPKDVTDINGNYLINNLLPGNYPIKVYADNSVDYVSERKIKVFAVEKGKNLVNVNFKLYKGGSIVGTLYESDGIEKVVNSLVCVNDEKSEYGKLADSVGCNRTDNSGKFYFSAIPASNKVVLYIKEYGYSFFEKEIQVNKNQITNVELLKDYDKSTGIKSKILDIDGKPFANKRILFYKKNIQGGTEYAEDEGYCLTDNNGLCSMLGLKPDTYYLMSGSAKFLNLDKGIEIVKNVINENDILVKRK